MNYRTACIFLIALLPVITISCIIKRPSEGSGKAGKHITNTVGALGETEPVPRKRNVDSADDPAIWINRNDPENSVVIGTDKKGGIATYDLNGNQLNYYRHGAMNNTDVRYGFPLAGKKIDLLASSNLTRHSIALHKISEGGILEPVHARTIFSDLKGEVYGLCMYQSAKTDKYFVFLSSKRGGIEQWELFEKNGKVDAKPVRSFKIESKTEGMVADDVHGILYLGEEDKGIFKLDAEPDGSTEGKLIPLSSEENKNIRFDIEGLAIYRAGNGKGYLIASSQGNYSYAVFERQGDNNYLGSFRIVDGAIDGVEETDGLDVTSTPLGSKFPKGMLVVQDGYNFDGKKYRSQNFKYISMEEVERILER